MDKKVITPAKIEVRFRDCDMMGHVNNAVYLSYFEQTRLHYFKQMLTKEWDYSKHGILLVRNEVEYLKPIFLNDAVEVYMHVKEIGTKSFTFSYEVSVNNVICTYGLSKLVCFDFHKNESVPVYPEFIEAFNNLN